MRVASVAQRSPCFLRVRLAGPDAGLFGRGGLHVRLLLPPAGRAPVGPRRGASGRTEWPDGAGRRHRPVYPVAAHGQDWLDLGIYRHADSPTCGWTLSTHLGATVGIVGPGGGWCHPGKRLHLFGDQTALPAIARTLFLTGAGATALVAASLDDLACDMRVIRCGDLMVAQHHADPQPGSVVWFAAEARQARAARRHLKARKIAPGAVTTARYRTRGKG